MAKYNFKELQKLIKYKLQSPVVSIGFVLTDEMAAKTLGEYYGIKCNDFSSKTDVLLMNFKENTSRFVSRSALNMFDIAVIYFNDFVEQVEDDSGKIIFDADLLKKDKPILVFKSEDELCVYIDQILKDEIAIPKDFSLTVDSMPQERFYDTGKNRLLTLDQLGSTKGWTYAAKDLIKTKKLVKQEVTKEMGQQVNVTIKQAVLNKDGAIETITHFEDNIVSVNETVRTVTTATKTYENVIEALQEGTVLIPNKKAKIITTDTRAFWVAIKTEITSKALMASCGLMTEKECKAEVAALELKLEKYSEQIMNKIEF